MQCSNLHRYFTPMRPPAMGAVPKAGLKAVHFCDKREPVPGCRRPVWGWVDYDRALTEQEVRDYELISEWNAAMQTCYYIPSNYLDNFFGAYAPTDYDVQLADAMISAKLPENVGWFGEELHTPYDDTDEAREVWNAACDAAFEEFTSIMDDAQYIAAAQHYGIALPADYEPNWGE